MTLASAQRGKNSPGDRKRVTQPTPWYWTREQYYALGERGWFENGRVMLIRGRIIEMPPMGIEHARVCTRVRNLMQRIFEPARWVREDKPISIKPDSEPQPDVSVTEHPMEHYTSDHPKTALLVVEVSGSTLKYDRENSGLYASAAIPEYWIVNLMDKVIEVHRTPLVDATNEYGFRYADVRTFGKNDAISPLAQPDAKVRVSDILD
jgi:Uma2 family endonuclease